MDFYIWFLSIHFNFYTRICKHSWLAKQNKQDMDANILATLWLMYSFFHEIQKSIHGRKEELWESISWGRWRRSTVQWQTGWHSAQLWSASTYGLCSEKAQHCLHEHFLNRQMHDDIFLFLRKTFKMESQKQKMWWFELWRLLTYVAVFPSSQRSFPEKSPCVYTRSSSWRSQLSANWTGWQGRPQLEHHSVNKNK